MIRPHDPPPCATPMIRLAAVAGVESTRRIMAPTP